MRISFFADSKFVADGRGGYYSSSNMRRSMLDPIADRCDRLYLVCRLLPTGFPDVPETDVIRNPKIEFVGVPSFRGVFGSLLIRGRIRSKVAYALRNSDVAVLRFGSNISCLAAPILMDLRKPSIGHVIGDLTVEIRTNPRHVPIPVVRGMVAEWSSRRNQRAFGACDVLCGVTEEIARRYAPPGRAVHQLVDSCLAPSCYSAPRQVPHQPMRAVFAGRLLEFKNVQSFLRAVGRLKREGVRVGTTVIGDGDYRTRLETLARELDLEGDVEFTGRIESREALWGRYRDADLGFLLSASEGLPLGAIEPMSAGLPLIAADRAYMKGVVTEGEEGFLVDPADVAAIAERIRTFAMDPALRYRMARAAHSRSAAFSADSQAAALIDLANQAMEERGRSLG